MAVSGHMSCTRDHLDRVSMASLFIIGIVTMWAGFNYPLSYLDLELFDPEPYNIIKTILSFSLICMGLILVKSHHMTVAIIAIIVGISACSFSVTDLLFDRPGDYLMDILFAFPLMIIAVFYLIQGRRYRAYATGIFSISLVVMSVFAEYRLSLLGGFGLLISGTMFMLLGVVGLLRKEKVTYDPEIDYGYEMVSIAGFMFMTLYILISSLEVYDYTFYVVSFMLSSVIVSIAIMGLVDGILLESLVQFMYGFACLIFAIDRLFGGQGYVFTDTAVGIIIGICGVMFLMRRQFTLAIPCILFGILIVPGFEFEQGFIWAIASLSMLPFIGYYCLSRWLYRDTGKEILPITE